MPTPVEPLVRAITPLCGIAVALFVAYPAGAQEGEVRLDENPRVERLTFRGASGVDEADLRAAIETQETRCHAFLLRPLCALTDWGILLEEHHLEPEELEADELRLRVYYYQRGYRSARAESEVRRRGDGVEVVFRVDEGPVTRIESYSLRQPREVLSDRRIRRANLPDEGDPLDLIRLAEGLADLAEAFGERGHLDAALRDSIAVAPDGLRAVLAVELHAGPRSTLDTLVVLGNERVSRGAIANALRLRQGRVLRTNDIAASQRALYESNLFHEARVRVPEQPDSAKRVELAVREAPPRSAEVGVGFNSMEFAQVRGRFTHYDWLGGSRRLDLNATGGNLLARQLNGRAVFTDVLPDGPAAVAADEFLKPTWQISAEFRQPTFLSAANVAALSVFAHRRTIVGIAVDEGYGGEVSLTRRLDFPTPVSASYRFERAGVLAGELYFCVNYGICEGATITALQGRHRLSPLALSYVDNRADDPVAPSTGYRVRAELEHASALTQSDFGYARFSGTAAYYRPLDLHRRRVLAGRLRAGWVHALEANSDALGLPEGTEPIVHPRKRFYAGGSRSVRGFQENQLGPRVLTVDPIVLLEEGGCTEAEVVDGSCDPSGVPVAEFLPRPSGGSSVIEGNVEYRFPLGESWQGAVFVDAAAVGNGWKDLVSRGGSAVTPGFGTRWTSPVGPVRVDLGFRPLVVEELDVVTEYVDSEGRRRLIRLDTPRRYDPLEDTRGFFGQVLGRMVLHLSIGEAF